MKTNLLELWGQTLLEMAKIAKGPKSFFDLFQNGFAKQEPKPDSMQEQFMKLCQKTFGKKGIEGFNAVWKEFYENVGVIPRTQYNELQEKFVELKKQFQELESKIAELKRKFEDRKETPIDLMDQWTETLKKYAEINQKFFEEFSRFFKP